MARKRAGRRTFGATRQLPSGKWQASYLKDGRRYVAPNTFVTAGDANAWLTKVEGSISDGTWVAPDAVSEAKPGEETFGSYGTRWLAHRPDLRESSRERYERLWRLYLKPTFEDVPLGKLTRDGWRTWYTEACADHPGSTQPGAAYRLARAILNTAVEDDIIATNPCAVKKAAIQETPERPVVTPEDVARIVSHLDDRYRALVLLAAYGSLRFGELAGLRRSDVNVLHRSVNVRQAAVELSSGRVTFGPPKTTAGIREVAVPDGLVPVIEHHLATYTSPGKDALVFTSPEGHPLRRTKFRNRWIKACEKTGITGLHFHDLRGSGATWAAQAGATVAELQARLGHKTTTMAMRYQHATKERDKAIAAKLGTMYEGAGANDPDDGVTAIAAR